MKYILLLVFAVCLSGCDDIAYAEMRVKESNIDALSREVENLQKQQQHIIKERERLISEMHQNDIRMDSLVREIFYDKKSVNITQRDLAELKKRE